MSAIKWKAGKNAYLDAKKDLWNPTRRRRTTTYSMSFKEGGVYASLK